MMCRGGTEAQMCRDVDMEVLMCRDGAGAGKEVQRLYKGAKEVQMQRKCRGGKEQVQRCWNAEAV
jgi:hypothetical protein